MTVGYLGNQSKTEPEMDQFAVWRTRAAAPQLMGPLRANLIAEFVDVNDRGQAIGMTGTKNPRTGFSPGQGRDLADGLDHCSAARRSGGVPSR